MFQTKARRRYSRPFFTPIISSFLPTIVAPSIFIITTQHHVGARSKRRRQRHRRSQTRREWTATFQERPQEATKGGGSGEEKGREGSGQGEPSTCAFCIDML